MRYIQPELVVAARDEVGEGPIWDGPNRTLLWLDIAAGVVHRLETGSETPTDINLSEYVGSIGLRTRSGVVLCLRDGFGIAAELGGPIERIPIDLMSVRETRFNDGRCDAVGRLWAGTVAAGNHEGAGALYRLSSVDGHFDAVRMLDGVTISNGIDWSPDGSQMFYVDSATHRIDVFDFDCAAGGIAARRVLTTVSSGIPDGITVDSEGAIWVALWGGWAVHRYLSTGLLDSVVPLPVGQVTSCVFGGPSLDTLYITSARSGLSQSQLTQQPLAGSLFACRPGVSGRLPNRFAG